MSFRIATVLLLTASLTGCASYVNIPPDSNEDIAINAINAPPTPGLISAALDYVLMEHPAPQVPYGVRLPVEASDTTWTKILRERQGAVAFSQLDPGQPVYDVRSIRIRGDDAWVDVVVPQTRDNRPLVELRLAGHVTGWRVTSVRHWSARVISERESSGQYGPGESSVPMLRLTDPESGEAATPPAAQGETEEFDAVIEVLPESGERRPLTPIRPVKPDGGG